MKLTRNQPCEQICKLIYFIFLCKLDCFTVLGKIANNNEAGQAFKKMSKSTPKKFYKNGSR